MTTTNAKPTKTTNHFMAVYAGADGKTCIGHILARGRRTDFEAFDRDDESLGIFPDMKAAAAAISATEAHHE